MILLVGSLKMNTTLEYSTRVVQEGDRRCKKSTLNDIAYLTHLRIPLMNPVYVNGMPQKDTLDRSAYTCMLVSYRRFSPQFQFSLSGVTLVYLSQWYLRQLRLVNLSREGSEENQSQSDNL